MPTELPPVPHSVPIINQGGFTAQVWLLWFQKAFQRIGGTTSYTNDELYSVGTDRIEDNAVTPAKIPDASLDASKLAASVAGAGLSGGAGTALAVNVDGATLEIATDTLRVKDSGIPFAKLLSTDWSSTKATSGYFKVPSGLIVQWGVTGSVSSGTTQGISFSVAFPTACAQVLVSARDNSAVATTATGQVGSGNYSTTGADLYNRTSVSQTINWIAVGY
jgi:hypothetical protein